MFYLTTRIEELAEETTDERILAFLEYIMRGLDGHMQRLFSLPLVWTPYTTLESPVLVEYVTSPSEDAPEGAVTAPVATTTNVPSSTELLALEDFYQTYKGRVTSDAPLSDLCIAYFDEIDAVAKRYDFPTSLIIATWFREHTCIFENPANTRGNFQITSHRYPAGSISWSDFENQIINFITFSQGKWEYYDNVQTYGPAPITLSYDTIDLASLRKHAIFYNGITSTLEENIYANQNF